MGGLQSLLGCVQVLGELRGAAPGVFLLFKGSDPVCLGVVLACSVYGGFPLPTTFAGGFLVRVAFGFRGGSA